MSTIMWLGFLLNWRWHITLLLSRVLCYMLLFLIKVKIKNQKEKPTQLYITPSNLKLGLKPE
jgi:hypothetical protein